MGVPGRWEENSEKVIIGVCWQGLAQNERRVPYQLHLFVWKKQQQLSSKAWRTRAIFTCDFRVIAWTQKRKITRVRETASAVTRDLCRQRWVAENQTSLIFQRLSLNASCHDSNPRSVRKSICRFCKYLSIYHFISSWRYYNSHQKVIQIALWLEWFQNVPASLFRKIHWLSRKIKRTLTLYQNLNTCISDSNKNFQQPCITMSEHSQSKRMILLVGLCVAIHRMIKQYILKLPKLLPRPRLVMREFSNCRLYITLRPWKNYLKWVIFQAPLIMMYVDLDINLDIKL